MCLKIESRSNKSTFRQYSISVACEKLRFPKFKNASTDRNLSIDILMKEVMAKNMAKYEFENRDISNFSLAFLNHKESNAGIITCV